MLWSVGVCLVNACQSNGRFSVACTINPSTDYVLQSSVFSYTVAGPAVDISPGIGSDTLPYAIDITIRECGFLHCTNIETKGFANSTAPNGGGAALFLARNVPVSSNGLIVRSCATDCSVTEDRGYGGAFVLGGGTDSSASQLGTGSTAFEQVSCYDCRAAQDGGGIAWNKVGALVDLCNFTKCMAATNTGVATDPRVGGGGALDIYLGTERGITKCIVTACGSVTGRGGAFWVRNGVTLMSDSFVLAVVDEYIASIGTGLLHFKNSVLANVGEVCYRTNPAQTQGGVLFEDCRLDAEPSGADWTWGNGNSVNKEVDIPAAGSLMSWCQPTPAEEQQSTGAARPYWAIGVGIAIVLVVAAAVLFLLIKHRKRPSEAPVAAAIVPETDGTPAEA